MKNIDHALYEEIVENSFGGETLALWNGLCGCLPELPYEECKNIFLQVALKLLNDKRVRFCVPNELWKDGDDIWGIDSNKIISYIAANWPKDISNTEDLKLVDFFYDVAPAILWVDDDGSIVGS